MNNKTLIVIAFFTILIAACIPTNQNRQASQTLAPALATGTALFANKQTAAAELTLYLPTSMPVQTGPAPTIFWTPSPGEITANDSGQTYNISITSRISIILDKSEYPPANLEQNCVPGDALGQISNIPIVPPEDYVVRYEGVEVGQCVISNGGFAVTINIVSNP